MSGRPSDELSVPKLWVPHTYYTHLAINDYLAQRIPERSMACPEDSYRLSWQANPTQIDGEWRWAYSSSYTAVACAYSADVVNERGQTVGPLVGFSHRQVNPGRQMLGGRKLTEVSFPSSKVSMYDMFARHAKKLEFCAYPETAQPLLFFDSSVRMVRSGDCNPGSNPNDPYNPTQFEMTYWPNTPLLGEPPTRSGAAQENVKTYYQWTRSGLGGVDIGGEEIPSF